MSTPKTLVLTRPAESSLRILNQIKAMVGHEQNVLIAPVIKIVATQDWPDLSEYTSVIATSANAIQGPLHGKPVFCVGARTSEAVREAGGDVRHCALDAEALTAWLQAQPDFGPAMYLRGSHVATDLVDVMRGHPSEIVAHEVYRQEQHALTDEAIQLLEGERPAILPLYSPRSARLVGEGIAQAGSNLHVIAISDAVAEIWQRVTGGTCEVADLPTGEAMMGRIVAALQC